MSNIFLVFVLFLGVRSFSDARHVIEKRQSLDEITEMIVTEPSIEVRRCNQNCLKTPEYNPVCGSDNIVYTNLAILECARRCSKPDLRVIRQGSCPQVDEENQNNNQNGGSTRPSTTTSRTSPRQVLNQSCAQSCVKTPEYNPVCGSNGESYQNMNELNCARGCGLSNLQFSRLGRCPPPADVSD